jgi:uncharacterized protein with HEPN domain
VRTDRERLIDISDAIHKIEEQTGFGEERFRSDEMVQVWVVYHLQIIGEAVARLSQALKANSPGVPWADIVGMRNSWCRVLRGPARKVHLVMPPSR